MRDGKKQSHATGENITGERENIDTDEDRLEDDQAPNDQETNIQEQDDQETRADKPPDQALHADKSPADDNEALQAKDAADIVTPSDSNTGPVTAVLVARKPPKRKKRQSKSPSKQTSASTTAAESAGLQPTPEAAPKPKTRSSSRGKAQPSKKLSPKRGHHSPEPFAQQFAGDPNDEDLSWCLNRAGLARKSKPPTQKSAKLKSGQHYEPRNTNKPSSKDQPSNSTDASN